MGKPEKKPEQHAPSPIAAPAKGVGGRVGCLSVGCKSTPHKMEFCDEHFKQFKFGLVNKKGEQVPDYEKKLEHYERLLKSQKVA